MDIDNKTKLKAYGAIMSEAGYKNLIGAATSGIPIKTYVKFLGAAGRIKSDLKDGKTVSGSKRAKVLTYINALNVTDKAKDKLYELAGYSESTIYETPWRNEYYAYNGDIFGIKLNGKPIPKKEG